jgi:hypothetical protein
MPFEHDETGDVDRRIDGGASRDGLVAAVSHLPSRSAKHSGCALSANSRCRGRSSTRLFTGSRTDSRFARAAGTEQAPKRRRFMTTIDIERTLAQLRHDLHTAAQRRIRRRRRLRYALFLPLALPSVSAQRLRSPRRGRAMT